MRALRIGDYATYTHTHTNSLTHTQAHNIHQSSPLTRMYRVVAPGRPIQNCRRVSVIRGARAFCWQLRRRRCRRRRRRHVVSAGRLEGLRDYLCAFACVGSFAIECHAQLECQHYRHTHTHTHSTDGGSDLTGGFVKQPDGACVGVCALVRVRT